MMSPFPPNLAKCYRPRFWVGCGWLGCQTVCLSNLGLFHVQTSLWSHVHSDWCLSVLGLVLAWLVFGLVSGGIWAFFAFMPSVSACVLLGRCCPGWWMGCSCPFPNRLFARLLGPLWPWLAVGLLVSLRLAVAWWFFLGLFSLRGPLGFLLVVLAAVSRAFVSLLLGCGGVGPAPHLLRALFRWGAVSGSKVFI